MPRKSSKGKGGKKGGKAGKDPVTGRYIEDIEGGRSFISRDDVIYGWNSGGTPGNFEDDTYVALKSVPPEVNGVHSGYDAVIQYQFSDKAIVQTRSVSTARIRVVFLGDFKYDKQGRVTSGRVNYRVHEDASYNGERHGGTFFPLQDTVYRSDWRSVPQEFLNYQPDDQIALTRAFGGGKYFYEGWHNNLFDTSII